MKRFQVMLLIAILVSSFLVPLPKAAQAATLPANFQESIVFSGLTHPTSIRFAPDGRIFIAEKSGLIKIFDSLTDTTPTVFADLRTQVDDYWDRGLLGLELDPNFPTNPYVYALYTYDAAIGGTAPTWNDACPTPPGPTTDGCLVSGRLSRLVADATGTTMQTEQVLINDWCQQFPSHSIGDLRFGPDGALYVSGGDGASFNYADYGQTKNLCGDPPGPAGTNLTPPTAEGGALRSQSLNRLPGDPVVLNGAILRLDPATGNALSTNPLFGNSNSNAKRIIAYGLRNPFRFTFRPGTSELWVGDVGWSTWEEINRIINPTTAPISNFGWPCYEGNNNGSAPNTDYQSANLTICANLYNTAGAVTAPYYAYNHSAQVVSGETCATNNGSVISGITFYNTGSYPSAYNGALFFGDHSRNCIWVMFPGSNGLPDKTKISTFIAGAANPVDLEIGPGGDLFYADFDGGTIRRVSYAGSGNQPPVSIFSATPTSGTAPLLVNFDGSGSYDPDAGDGINAYSWDLNGDGNFGDAITATTSYTYDSPGSYTASLKVTDKHGATAISSVTISANNTAPAAVIDTPAACASTNPCWIVGQAISFSGHATDQQDGNLPASALSWSVLIHHCTAINSCHTHTIQTYSGVASGTFTAPDHDYPSYLEFQLTATDSGGLQNTSSVLLYPKTVDLTFQSNPSGLQLSANNVTATTSFVRTVIVNSNNSLSAPTPQTLNGIQYAFQSWSDGGAQTHNILAGTSNASFTANYTPVSADVQIVKTGALSSGKITYTLQVRNNGPAQALGVVAKDVLPSKLQFVSVSTGQGTCTGGSTVTCQIGNMSNGQTVTITIVTNVSKVAGFVTNTATVSASTPDTNTANNSSSAQTKTR